MATPQISIDNFDLNQPGMFIPPELDKSQTYQDLSTICIIPTRGVVPAKVVQSWWGLMVPMNQKFIRTFVIGMEVGAAYTQAIEQIIANPILRTWKYILTLEEDNMPPPDGLLKLYESMDKFDVVGGLYWTKGDGGQPMIYGDPKSKEMNFIPQVPLPDTVQECNGLGMGFNLYKMDIFRDPRVPRPYFKTLQEFTPGVGGRGYSQDLYFYESIRKLDYKVACDTRIKVGHYDLENDIIW
jgi:hypothetical protein